MEPISQEFSKKNPSYVDDDGFLLGVSIDLPMARPSATEEKPVAELTIDLSADVSGENALAAEEYTPPAPQIPDRMYFRIGDVAELAGVKPYVLRYWESEFPVISPEKSSTGQRVYRRTDVETILLIKNLLYNEKYSIEGARKRIQEVRRGGQLKAFKSEKVYGGRDAAMLREKVKQAREIVEELSTIAKLPIREIFRY